MKTETLSISIIDGNIILTRRAHPPRYLQRIVKMPIVERIDDLVEESQATANKQGLITQWESDGTPKNIMWAVSELGEAFEAWRDDDKDLFLEEIADTFITLAHLVGDLNLKERFLTILNWKLAYNRTRPEKHGYVRA